MKKFILIAAVAVAATAACTKSENVSSPDVKIAFDVAQYSAQVKANMANNDELGGSFTTNAWFTNGDGDKMRFFRENETVSWNTPVANQAGTLLLPTSGLPHVTTSGPRPVM